MVVVGHYNINIIGLRGGIEFEKQQQFLLSFLPLGVE